jgi:hypothetical protein
MVRWAFKRRETAEERARSLAKWLRIAAAKGYKRTWATRYKYEAVYGGPPSPDVWALTRQLLGEGVAA